ncbi:MAG: hypothetical protein O3B64_01095 [bacterium]|nr:hypothetical protein [bacterium]MDA1024502.1 hypothetical protein [bacterium]
MNGYITNREKATLENTDYRRVLYTTHRSQLVLMSIESGDEIRQERHGLDQFIRIEQDLARLCSMGEKRGTIHKTKHDETEKHFDGMIS